MVDIVAIVAIVVVVVVVEIKLNFSFSNCFVWHAGATCKYTTDPNETKSPETAFAFDEIELLIISNLLGQSLTD